MCQSFGLSEISDEDGVCANGDAKHGSELEVPVKRILVRCYLVTALRERERQRTYKLLRDTRVITKGGEVVDVGAPSRSRAWR